MPRTRRAGAAGTRACLAGAQAIFSPASLAAVLQSRSRMRGLRRVLIAAASGAPTRRRATYHHFLPSSLAAMRATLRKCDVLLVDGDQRVSQVIKYLTQSAWSHSAIYVGDELWRRQPERRAE